MIFFCPDIVKASGDVNKPAFALIAGAPAMGGLGGVTLVTESRESFRAISNKGNRGAQVV
ncbi:hypothetical protein MICA_279 [Micavibrio aeruginosavorus ARL-13]|uniref:Uncharacterized protein n=1 Tax=Micavibrio aeruginosavorus (strain ARL-13) TaxID=856793 RepID=G2KQ82_MICAA|nr:hypothetical protein MICA_279 [Micavibrio aeruginosavorus ARL-13]